MTEEARFFVGIAATVAVNGVLVGAAWGNLSAGQKRMKSDVENIEKALGLANGAPARFITREEIGLMRESADNEHKEFRRRIDALENEKP